MLGLSGHESSVVLTEWPLQSPLSDGGYWRQRPGCPRGHQGPLLPLWTLCEQGPWIHRRGGHSQNFSCSLKEDLNASSSLSSWWVLVLGWGWEVTSYSGRSQQIEGLCQSWSQVTPSVTRAMVMGRTHQTCSSPPAWHCHRVPTLGSSFGHRARTGAPSKRTDWSSSSPANKWGGGCTHGKNAKEMVP